MWEGLWEWLCISLVKRFLFLIFLDCEVFEGGRLKAKKELDEKSKIKSRLIAESAGASILTKKSPRSRKSVLSAKFKGV